MYNHLLCKSCYRGLNSRPLPYQGSALPLSYNSKKESGKRGSNPRPPAWKASALSTELFPHFSFIRKSLYQSGQRWIRTTEGVSQQIYSLPHLATLVFALACFRKANTFFLSLLSDSNQRPRDYKSRALAN